jgi:plastocyanin
MRRVAIITATALLAVVAAAPLADATTRSVAVRDSFFSPATKTVKKNDIVRFSWARADAPHNVKFTKVPRGAKKPRSCGTRSSGTCKRKLARRGTYRYVCTLHLASDNMRGKVVVK